MSSLYIHRKLHWDERLIQDHELLGKSGVFVVLAEPGAGKSDLLDYYSERHAVPRELASLFIHRTPSNPRVLIIDALDEVARISEDKINEIIVKARASGAEKVIFASRSYIWDEARTRIVRDCFGIEPAILRLEPFDDDEQRQLFNNYVPGEDFDRFRTEADRLDLTPRRAPGASTPFSMAALIPLRICSDSGVFADRSSSNRSGPVMTPWYTIFVRSWCFFVD
jgi:hypothetical protein